MNNSEYNPPTAGYNPLTAEYSNPPTAEYSNPTSTGYSNPTPLDIQILLPQVQYLILLNLL